MNPTTQNAFAAAARLLLAALFLVSGVNKIMDFAGTQAFMAAAGLPMPELLLILTIALELTGGMMILTGVQTRCAGAALVLFLIPATYVFHNPWVQTDPAMAREHLIHLLKNLAIIGGLLHLMAFGSGGWRLAASQEPPEESLRHDF